MEKQEISLEDGEPPDGSTASVTLGTVNTDAHRIKTDGAGLEKVSRLEAVSGFSAK